METEEHSLKFDFEKFAALTDEEIDADEILPISSLQSPTVGKYSDVEFRSYDVRSIANWCIRKAKLHDIKVGKLWLNKLVALIYENALLEKRVLLTPARMEAWEFGPVFREIYYSFPNNPDEMYHRFNVVRRAQEEAIDHFQSDDIQLFEKVWEKFGHLSGSRLTTITHASDTAWSKVWNAGGSVNPGMQIGVQTILGRDGDQGNAR